MGRRTWGIGLASLVCGALLAASATAVEPELGEAVWYSNVETLLSVQESEASARKDSDTPADALYQRARSALNREHYRHAAELFKKLSDEHSQSVYASESMYWRALALYQLGDAEDLEEARAALEDLVRRYQDSAMQDEARDLKARIRARQARSGDLEAAEDVYRDAHDLVNEARHRDSEDHHADHNADDEIDHEADCKDDNRITAVQALMQMNSSRALPILKKVLQKRDDCWQLRERALFVISQVDDPEVAEILIDAAKNDPHHEVREQAVFWLSQVPGEASLDAINEILLSTNDHDLQEKCIFALSQHRSERAAHTLREYAADPSKSTDIRENAIFWLGQNHGRQHLAFLFELYGELQDHDLRERVIFAVSQMGGSKSAEWLRQRALDRNESIELRKNALFWAAQQEALGCDEFSRIYDGFQDREMREQVVFGLSQMQDDCAIEALIEIFHRETDHDLRENVIFWLGQSNDDRAFKFIEELIDP